MKNKFMSNEKNLINKYHRPQKILPRLNVDLCLSPNDSFSESKKARKVKRAEPSTQNEGAEAISKDQFLSMT